MTSRVTWYDTTHHTVSVGTMLWKTLRKFQLQRRGMWRTLFIKDKCNSDISIKNIWRTTRAVSWWSFRISNKSGLDIIASGNVATDCPVSLVLSWRWSCFLLCVSHRKNWSDTAAREMEDFLILFLLSVFNLSLLFNVYSFILCILILIIYSLICFGIYFYVFCTYYWISFSHWQNNFHLEFWNQYSVWIRLKQIWN